MQGSTGQKLARLLFYLACHPQMIPLYLRESSDKQATPLSLQLPWISYPAISRLEQFIRKDHLIAEFGGGGSTLFFSRRAHSVLCIESDGVWAEKVKTALKENNLENVTVETCPYDAKDAAAYAASSNLHKIDGLLFDVILVDGYEEDVPLRPICFYHAEKCIRENGIIVVDDSWRYPGLRQKNKAKRWEEHLSIGPCRPGVTSTDIFYY